MNFYDFIQFGSDAAFVINTGKPDTFRAIFTDGEIVDGDKLDVYYAVSKRYGQWLRTLREKWRMSQEELGDELGVSRQAISSWETGESLPKEYQRMAIVNYFLTKEK